jgi:hypothetical protein
LPQPLFVSIGPRFPAYEIYANGEKIGSFGGPLESWWGQLYAEPKRFPLPRTNSIVLAIRTADWHLPMGAQSATAAASQSWIGVEAAIANQEADWRLNRYQRYEPLRMVCLLVLGASAYFIALALWRRRNYEYLFIGLFVGGNALFRLLQVAPEWLGNPNRLLASYLAAAYALLEYPSMMLFAWVTFGSRPRGFTWFAYALGLPGIAFMLPEVGDWTASLPPHLAPLLVAVATAAEGLIYFDLARRAPPSEHSYWPIHAAFGVFISSNVAFYVMQISGGLALGGDMITVTEILLRSAILVFAFAMGIILSQRSAKADREQGRLRQEMAAAGEVQRLLLAGEREATPGFDVTPVYLPATEVGGDFFQIRALAEGGLLVLVGDVSGKGLKAAMLVSVMIGVLRREVSASPAAILGVLNRAVLGQTGGGFVTCCCARFSPGGSVILANAGHLAPYRDGEETAAPAGLPLGVLAEVRYEESTFENGMWLFLTDGVVEAASARGELFGFERTQRISAKTAHEIAEAARSWGQNDDITVVTVRRVE